MFNYYKIFFCLNIFFINNGYFYANLNEKFTLFTVLYNEENEIRINEYLYCLQKNINHPYIDKVYIIYDTSKDNNRNYLLNCLKNLSSVEICYLYGRPQYDYLFYFINSQCPDKKIILSNADIYFDDSLLLLKNYDLNNKFLSLTRWDVSGENTLIPVFAGDAFGYGADTWIFKSPIKDIGQNNYCFGSLYCDHFLIYEISKSKLILLNPCYDIKACHVHASGIHHYNITPRPNDKIAWAKAGWLKDKHAEIIYNF